MGTGPQGPGTQTGRPVFSPDGFWWWDGAQWRSTISPDGLWRWNGQAWEPNRAARPMPGRGGTASTIVITLAAAVGILILVTFVVGVILYAMGNQIANVFSNVAAALGSTPSP